MLGAESASMPSPPRASRIDRSVSSRTAGKKRTSSKLELVVESSQVIGAEPFLGSMVGAAHLEPAMVWISGPDSLHTFFDERWLEFRGRTLDEELGRRWMDAIHPEDIGRYMRAYLLAFEHRRSFQSECRLKDASGQYVPMLCRGIPQYCDEGTFMGFVGSMEEMDPSAPASERAVLHDVLNAVAGLEMLTELLAECVLPEEPTEFVKLLHSSVNRLLGQINRQKALLEVPIRPS
jgi:PAS fold